MSTISLASNSITYNGNEFHTSEVVPVYSMASPSIVNSDTGWVVETHYQIVIEFTSPTPPLYFFLKDITNQPTWTDDAAGAQNAIDDIRAVLPVPGGGGGGVSSVGATAPITSTGGATPNIGIQDSGVVANSYANANITVDAKGRVTAASDGAAYYVPLVYSAIVTDGAPPTTAEQFNSIPGVFVWSSGAAGVWTLTLAGAFVTGRTRVFVETHGASAEVNAPFWRWNQSTDDAIVITFSDAAGATTAPQRPKQVHIEVYP